MAPCGLVLLLRISPLQGRNTRFSPSLAVPAVCLLEFLKDLHADAHEQTYAPHFADV